MAIVSSEESKFDTHGSRIGSVDELLALATSTLLKLLRHLFPMLLAILVDLSEVLLDCLARHVRVDFFGDLIPRESNLQLHTDVVNAEKYELINVGWKVVK